MTAVFRTLAICSTLIVSFSTHTNANPEHAVIENYANIGYAVFKDSLLAAKALQGSINQFIANPSTTTHTKAQKAWIAARIPYQQSEVFRFGHAIVDDWEGRVNAWPLDEGLIDYIDQETTNHRATGTNIIANTALAVNHGTLDSRHITLELLASLNKVGGSNANIATGYHAIEFLLWGQDLNGTGAGAGRRSFTDYLPGKGCSNGHCERRATYLKTVTQLLVNDLEYMMQQWQPGKEDNYRATLLAQSPHQGLKKMLFGMEHLSLGELASKRMQVALTARAPEEEQDCFSDNTHHAYYYNALGIKNIYLGQYRRIDGTVVAGQSLSDWVTTHNRSLDQQTRMALAHTQHRMRTLVTTAEHADNPMKFDQMIAEGNIEGNKIIMETIQALVNQTRQLEKITRLIGINNMDASTNNHTI